MIKIFFFNVRHKFSKFSNILQQYIKTFSKVQDDPNKMSQNKKMPTPQKKELEVCDKAHSRDVPTCAYMVQFA